MEHFRIEDVKQIFATLEKHFEVDFKNKDESNLIE